MHFLDSNPLQLDSLREFGTVFSALEIARQMGGASRSYFQYSKELRVLIHIVVEYRCLNFPKLKLLFDR